MENEFDDIQKDSIEAVDEENRGVEELKLDEDETKQCVICTFSDGELIDTPDGWAHQECLMDQEALLHPNEKSALRDLMETKWY